MSDIFADKYNFIIEEVYKIMTGEGSRNAGFNRKMALSQPGCIPEKDPGLILVLFHQC